MDKTIQKRTNHIDLAKISLIGISRVIKISVFCYNHWPKSQEFMDKIIEKKKFTLKKFATYGGILLAICGVGLLYINSKGSKLNVDGEHLTIGEVKKEKFQEFIPVTGTVLPVKTVFIDAIEGGNVEEIFIEDGKEVNAGDPVIRLSNQQFQMDAINREAQLLEQQNNLRNTRIQMDQQTAQLREELLQVDYLLHDVKRKYEINKKLNDEKLIAKNDFEKSLEEFNYQKNKRKLILQKIKTDSLFRKNQLGQIESSLALIQRNLDFLQKSMENLTIKAPISGQLSSLKAELGETKSKGENIAQIDILTDYKVRAKIGEHYISRIYNGLKGEFSFDGKNYKLQVYKIYPEVSNGEFEVDLLFEGTKPEGIKRGQSVQIKLALSDETQAILVPRGGFYQTTGGKWMYVLTSDDKAVKKEVVLGRQNPDYYEVLSGLNPGDRVITSKYDAFNNADELLIDKK